MGKEGDEVSDSKRISSSILVQNTVDHLRDTALQTTTVVGKAFQKWLLNPLNLMFLLIIVVAHIQLFIAIIQGLLMVLLSKIIR